MITLSGGPLAGREVNVPEWAIGARMYLQDDEGNDVTYWRYDAVTAVFEGMGRMIQ